MSYLPVPDSSHIATILRSPLPWTAPSPRGPDTVYLKSQLLGPTLIPASQGSPTAIEAANSNPIFDAKLGLVTERLALLLAGLQQQLAGDKKELQQQLTGVSGSVEARFRQLESRLNVTDDKVQHLHHQVQFPPQPSISDLREQHREQREADRERERERERQQEKEREREREQEREREREREREKERERQQERDREREREREHERQEELEEQYAQVSSLAASTAEAVVHEKMSEFVAPLVDEAIQQALQEIDARLAALHDKFSSQFLAFEDQWNARAEELDGEQQQQTRQLEDVTKRLLFVANGVESLAQRMDAEEHWSERTDRQLDLLLKQWRGGSIEAALRSMENYSEEVQAEQQLAFDGLRGDLDASRRAVEDLEQHLQHMFSELSPDRRQSSDGHFHSSEGGAGSTDGAAAVVGRRLERLEGLFSTVNVRSEGLENRVLTILDKVEAGRDDICSAVQTAKKDLREEFEKALTCREGVFQVQLKTVDEQMQEIVALLDTKAAREVLQSADVLARIMSAVRRDELDRSIEGAPHPAASRREEATPSRPPRA